MIIGRGGVHVSFSGGKDSTVLLHLVRSLYPDTPAIFVDTGLEYPDVKEVVKGQENITILRPEMNFKKVIETYGYPIPTKIQARKIGAAQQGKEWAMPYAKGEVVLPDGKKSYYNVSKKWQKLVDAPFKVSDECCNIMKKKPLKKYEKENGTHPYVGTLATESLSRERAWMKNGCNAFNSTSPTSQPMAFWTETDVLQYIKDNDLKIAGIYGDIVESGKKIQLINGEIPELKTTGLHRTGCIYCMFGIGQEKCPNRFQRLKVNYPKLYDYCLKPMDEGGLGIKEVLEYCDIPY